MKATAIVQQNREAGIAHDSRVGKDSPNDSGVVTFVTCFLAQFANSGDLRRAVFGINHTTRDFQLNCACAMAKLLDHDQVVVRCGGHNVDPVGRIDDDEIVRLPRAR